MLQSVGLLQGPCCKLGWEGAREQGWGYHIRIQAPEEATHLKRTNVPSTGECCGARETNARSLASDSCRASASTSQAAGCERAQCRTVLQNTACVLIARNLESRGF